MTEALYRKYRPTTFEDVVGQEHIERTLKNAIEQDKISHAYLFCGPRGTGKTTMARILAKALLCEKAPTTEPDGTCEDCVAIAEGTHPDVYELDAASRTGVENVREEIINRVHYAPTRGSVKIYIIDEVHMLSTAAFNALLKTLEEPPSHVVFVLCTTDPQKVPDTIHSRCQRFDFHRLGVDEIVARLGAVCVQEDVEFEPEALELIAHQAGGGMRNALTSLEQLAAFGEGHVTLKGANTLLGSLDDEGLTDIVQALGRRDAAACFTWVSHYVETGADIAQFTSDLAQHMRNLYLMSLTDADVEISASTSSRAAMENELELFGPERLSRALGVLGDLMKELRATTNSRLAFEIALTRLLRPESDLTLASLSERLEELENKMLLMPGLQAQVQAATAAQPAPVVQAAPAVQPQPALTTPAPIAALAPQPVPAPQQTPAPAPQPAPQPMPAPVPATAPQVSPAPAPVPEQQPVATPVAQSAVPVANEPQQAAPVPQQPSPVPSSLDLSNPAALQRMWHQVTTTLRKANPARGVLFMGSKVEADPQSSGINIVFSPDSSFAYAAAQKKEVKDLLAQTFAEVLGATPPFQLVMAQGQVQSQQSAPVSAPAANPVPASAPAASAASAPAPVAAQPASPQPISTPQPVADPATSGVLPRYEDESPFFEEDVPVEAPVSSAPVAQTATASAPVSQVSSASAPAAQAAPAPSLVSQPSSAPAAMSSSTEPTEEEIMQNLTSLFGDGVKFDTIDQ